MTDPYTFKAFIAHMHFVIIFRPGINSVVDWALKIKYQFILLALWYACLIFPLEETFLDDHTALYLMTQTFHWWCSCSFPSLHSVLMCNWRHDKCVLLFMWLLLQLWLELHILHYVHMLSQRMLLVHDLLESHSVEDKSICDCWTKMMTLKCKLCSAVINCVLLSLWVSASE